MFLFYSFINRESKTISWVGIIVKILGDDFNGLGVRQRYIKQWR